MPRMDEWQVYPRVAAATGAAACAEGLARLPRPRAEIEALATERIAAARSLAAALEREGLIAPLDRR